MAEDELHIHIHEHVWHPGKTSEGDLDFRMNRQMSRESLLKVTCEICNTRTWFTKEQWESMPEEPS